MSTNQRKAGAYVKEVIVMRFLHRCSERGGKERGGGGTGLILLFFEGGKLHPNVL